MSVEENIFLMGIPAKAEIKATIDALHPLKASGPYGFSGIFFTHYWETIRFQVTNFVQESFRAGELEKCLNKSFIVLVPKSGNATEFNHFRPISLCNFTYKIISKIIEERLKIFLPRLISPNQGAFISGRWIADNMVLAHELVHKIKKFKGKEGLMMAKIDLSKAYDHLEWPFINIVLQSWGFSDSFQKMVFNCFSTVQHKLLINGNLAGEVTPSRGLRQGDLLSLYLFILCMDILSRLLEKKKKVKGIKISRGAPTIYHLMYANDMLLVGRASLDNAKAMWGCLDQFCNWSGQRVNNDKSNILFSPNTNRIVKKRVKDIWGLRNLKGNTIYLGNSLIQSRNKTQKFAKLKDHIQRRLEGW